MKRFLMSVFPGAENWLWRRVSCLGTIVCMNYCIVISARRGDAPSIRELGIVLALALATYVGGAVTDDHLKRKSGTDSDPPA